MTKKEVQLEEKTAKATQFWLCGNVTAVSRSLALGEIRNVEHLQSTTSSIQRNLGRTPREGCFILLFLQPTSGYPTCFLHISTPKPLDSKELKSFWWKLRLLYIPWKHKRVKQQSYYEHANYTFNQIYFYIPPSCNYRTLSIRFGIHSRCLSFEMKSFLINWKLSFSKIMQAYF